MALKATVYKAAINIADMDRHFFYDASLTIAQHPSETEQRMMLRLLAWICHADENLRFTKGLSADDEPEIWLRNDTLELEQWIELGLPDEKRLKKACSLSRSVVLYAYNERAAQVWRQSIAGKVAGYKNLTIYFINDNQLSQLATLAKRNMTLQATLQEGTIWLSDSENSLEITFADWQIAHQEE
ncbi:MULTISPECIES: YaeQ family protein [unclassified Brenneria]|uniref:YaeQ family protein n=1 Tax=unclassified Brenneria TaxID=2634434 RepID=UPI0029C4CB84|nr:MULTISPECIES: YaeQ family protein [unclassified Brenneria]MDX5628020.1 YaeQ family protein [Brenneria sp. L3-3Z]MDX5694960.1 YaeQ family protein [Brenneria sp. L4-2C]MEE3660748.1 YaeQ family protein [Brenneria sp. g21c3]